jgi:LacI family transcriptional regulator
MGRKSKEINSLAIAKLVGVSRSTVSKVINNYPNISEETRARVTKVIEEYGYFPNLSARILAGKRTDTLGFFYFDHGHFSEDFLVTSMISGLVEHAASFGYHILSYIVREPETERTKRMVREVFHQQRIDGGIILGARNHEPLVEELISEGFVLGIFDQDLPGKEERNRIVVNLDDERSAHDALCYLHGLGHRRIGVLNGDTRRSAGAAKQAGFQAAAEERGVEIPPEWSLYTDFSEASGYASMRKLLASGTRLPEAFAAANDSIAFGAMKAMAEKGIAIPDEVSLVGIDDHPMSRYLRPALTTFRYDFFAVMRRLVELIVHRIEDPDTADPRRQVFTPTFVERESCRRSGVRAEQVVKTSGTRVL